MSIEEFHIEIPDQVLQDLKFRLDHTRWPNQIIGSDWGRGTKKDYLQPLLSYWRNDYDWRVQEKVLFQVMVLKIQPVQNYPPALDNG